MAWFLCNPNTSAMIVMCVYWGVMVWYWMLQATLIVLSCGTYSASHWERIFQGMYVSFLWCSSHYFNTLRPRYNRRHFADDIFKCIFLNGNVWIQVKISLKFVPKSAINNIPALVQIMAWRRSGDKPLSEPMMVGLPTHICDTRPRWVNAIMVDS